MEKRIIDTDMFSIRINYEDDDFDYYTDISLELEYGNNSCIIFKDNLLELYNIVQRYKVSGIPSVETHLDIHSFGNKLNDIYQYDTEDVDDIEKYCAYVSIKTMTWLFKKDGIYCLLVTPAYEMLSEEDDDYKDFIESYSEIFLSEIRLEDLEKAADIIESLYIDLIGNTEQQDVSDNK